MEKVKSLLVTLALLFAAIAVFEFGARYGAANMRAYAIASELQLPLNIYVQGQQAMDPANKENFTILIDNGIAAGALHRQLWYVSKKSKATLEKMLARALTVRGDATYKRFKSAQSSEDLPVANRAKVDEILKALEKAKVDLVDNAPATEESEEASAAAKE